MAAGGCALVSCFIANPRIRWARPRNRLAQTEAARMVEARCANLFDNWLAADPKSAGAILDFLVLRGKERLRRRQEKETSAQDRDEKAAPARKLVDCSATNKEGTELFIVEGEFGGRVRQDEAATAKPKRCCPCAGK